MTQDNISGKCKDYERIKKRIYIDTVCSDRYITRSLVK